MDLREHIRNTVEHYFEDSEEIWGSLEEYVYGIRSTSPSSEVIEEASAEALLTWLLETGLHKLLD